MISQQIRQRTAPRRHRAVTAMVGFLLALAVMAVVGASVSASDSRPTIVLVHGGWAGPGAWSQVVGRLNADGYATATPTLGLDTLAGDVAIVQQTLDQIPGKKVLVGHSYGGECSTHPPSRPSHAGSPRPPAPCAPAPSGAPPTPPAR